ARQGLDIALCVGVIAERLSNLPDTQAQAALEVDELVRAPDPIAQVGSGDQITRTARQNNQDATGLRTQWDRSARLAQLAAGGVQFEPAETNNGEWRGGNGGAACARLRRVEPAARRSQIDDEIAHALIPIVGLLGQAF